MRIAQGPNQLVPHVCLGKWCGPLCSMVSLVNDQKKMSVSSCWLLAASLYYKTSWTRPNPSSSSDFLGVREARVGARATRDQELDLWQVQLVL